MHRLLVLFALLAVKRVGSVCYLCLESTEITNPDYILGLTDPYSIETCQDLSGALSFVPEDSDLCSSSRALSTLCGCPVRLEACSICGDSTITRPQQVLDSLVDLPYQETFGLARTCALVESRINQLNKTQFECLNLPMDKLQLYCGCSSIEAVADKGLCQVCPGGEIIPDDDSLFVTISDHDDIYGSMPYETVMSCTQVKVLASALSNDTALCSNIQRTVGASCGCPIPTNACRLCGEGILGRPDDKVEIPSGEILKCANFESLLFQVEANATECLAINFEKYRSLCRCVTKDEFVPCTLCPYGEPVPFPEKEIHGIDGLGVDFLEHTCGAIDGAARNIDTNSVTCSSARILSSLCGCSMPEGVCRICEPGQTMQNPFRELQWTFGSVNRLFPVYRENITISNMKFTCELADSFLANANGVSDRICFWNSLLRADACGCPRNVSPLVLVWTQRCSGFFSLVGSLLIIVSLMTKKRKELASTYNQIILCISMFDCMTSLAYMFDTALTPREIGLYGSMGNNATCGFQGWLFQVGIISVYYNVLLCFYFLLIIKYSWSERKLRKLRKWAHAILGSLGIIMAFAVIPFVHPDWRWCYVSKPPFSDSWLPGLFFFLSPISLCIVIMTVANVMLVLHVRSSEQRTRTKRIRREDGRKERPSLAKRVFWQSFWFLAAFYAVWPIQFVAFVITPTRWNYFIYFLAALLGPLQGFLNSLIVFHRDGKAIRRRAANTFGCTGSKEGGSSAMSSGSGWKTVSGSWFLHIMPWKRSTLIKKEPSQLFAEEVISSSEDMKIQNEDCNNNMVHVEDVNERPRNEGICNRDSALLEVSMSLEGLDGHHERLQESSLEYVTDLQEMPMGLLEHAMLSRLLDEDELIKSQEILALSDLELIPQVEGRASFHRQSKRRAFLLLSRKGTETDAAEES